MQAYAGKVRSELDHEALKPAAWRIDNYLEGEDSADEGLGALIGQRLVFNKNATDELARAENIDDYSVSRCSCRPDCCSFGVAGRFLFGLHGQRLNPLQAGAAQSWQLWQCPVQGAASSYMEHPRHRLQVQACTLVPCKAAGSLRGRSARSQGCCLHRWRTAGTSPRASQQHSHPDQGRLRRGAAQQAGEGETRIGGRSARMGTPAPSMTGAAHGAMGLARKVTLRDPRAATALSWTLQRSSFQPSITSLTSCRGAAAHQRHKHPELGRGREHRRGGDGRRDGRDGERRHHDRR